ncbi:hypothetical protein [Adhaeribacter terreus]|uniref:Uncharacterized protein n=1 Tax=Adhaeribacter terreus TaxID=529703 RepID=A0ABW0ECX2_9BACT
MELDIKVFLSRLNEQKAKGKTEAELVDFIHKEVRLTEITKASLMDEMNDKTADFLKDAAIRFDNYLFQLQEIEKSIRPQALSFDQQVALEDTAVREQIESQIKTIHEIDPEKYQNKDNTNPPENSAE